MAAPKSTAVFSAAFSTILTARRVDQLIHPVDAVLDRAEQDTHFKQTHGISLKGWESALSEHLHGDLR